MISIDNSNDPLLELPEYESFHFDNPSFLCPPPEPPDVCLDMLYNDESFEPGEGENIVVSNVEEDDSFTFTIRTFLPFLTYPEVSPLSCSTRSEDFIFDPGIITFLKAVGLFMEDSPNKFLKPLVYGYIKNHKKTVKNGQARTRESEEYKAEARKVKPQSKSAKIVNSRVLHHYGKDKRVFSKALSSSLKP
ncbi:hypothetical protein Tco_0596995 [Tanacetum coccineum]